MQRDVSGGAVPETAVAKLRAALHAAEEAAVAAVFDDAASAAQPGPYAVISGASASMGVFKPLLLMTTGNG